MPGTTELRDKVLAVSANSSIAPRPWGAVRAHVTRADVIPLMCGVAHAATTQAGDREAGRDTAHRCLALLLDGMRG